MAYDILGSSQSSGPGADESESMFVHSCVEPNIALSSLVTTSMNVKDAR